MSAGTAKNICKVCDKPFDRLEHAFLVGPVYITSAEQHNGTICIDRIGTTKRDLLHSECWECIISTASTQGKKDEHLIELDNRIQKALARAMQSGGVDGDHHKMWVIDQMVRELTGCPLEKKMAKDYKNVVYEYETLGENETYKEFVRNHDDGEDGPNTYQWDEGCPP